MAYNLVEFQNIHANNGKDMASCKGSHFFGPPCKTGCCFFTTRTPDMTTGVLTGAYIAGLFVFTCGKPRLPEWTGLAGYQPPVWPLSLLVALRAWSRLAAPPVKFLFFSKVNQLKFRLHHHTDRNKTHPKTC